MSHPTTILQDKTLPEIGHVFTELTVVDSSNNYAMALAHDGKAFHGDVFFAHEQTAGKGQRGKKWSANAGENIMMSIVMQPEKLSINEQFSLSASVALACYDLLNVFLPEKIFIKWPNDLYINDRKTGGILIENIISGEKWKFAIVGIGININQILFDENLPNPTSLKKESAKYFDVISLAKELCACIDRRYKKLLIRSYEEVIAEYNSHLYKRNEKVRLKNGDEIFETVIKEVSANGKLITVDEEERSFDFGEVSWQL